MSRFAPTNSKWFFEPRYLTGRNHMDKDVVGDRQVMRHFDFPGNNRQNSPAIIRGDELVRSRELIIISQNYKILIINK